MQDENNVRESVSPDNGGDGVVFEDSFQQDIVAERDRLAEENQQLSDRLLRTAAEFDNFRKRSSRERLEHFEYASMDAVRELLPVLDDFELALQAECMDKDHARGMQLIYQRMLDVLTKLGLERIESVGMPFDPHLHEAVESVPTPEVEDQTVLADLRRGYNFKGKLLRAAIVRVAVSPATRK